MCAQEAGHYCIRGPFRGLPAARTMPELADWEKELISQYDGDDDGDTNAAAEDGAATGDEVKGEGPAGAPSAAEGAPSAAAADPAATPAPVADAAPAVDAAPAAAPSEGGSADTLQAEVVKLRAEQETLNTLITQWQTSVKNLEEKARQVAPSPEPSPAPSPEPSPATSPEPSPKPAPKPAPSPSPPPEPQPWPWP